MEHASILDFGIFGTGKTYFAASLFASKNIDPDRVLYIDNHGSTMALDLPQYVKGEHEHGVLHLDFNDVDTYDAMAERVYTAAKSGNPLYDAIVIDDISEHELVAFDDAEGGFAGKDRRQLWGAHGQHLAQTMRFYDPVFTQAHLIVLARADWKPDPRVKPKPGDDEDKRPRKFVPAARGMFGTWIEHFASMVIYSDYDVDYDGNQVFYHQYRPTGDILLKNRWWHKEELPARLDWPTWDRLWSIISDF